MPNALDMARTVLGKTEGKDRAAIMDYLKTGGQNLDPSTTAWCAAFVNSSLKQAGYEGTGSNMARSFLEWGNAVKGDPMAGDVAVFPRGDPNGPYGHTGLVESYDPKTGMITMIGGNQSDSVSQSQYALSKALGIRRAAGSPESAAATGRPTDPVAAAGGVPMNGAAAPQGDPLVASGAAGGPLVPPAPGAAGKAKKKPYEFIAEGIKGMGGGGGKPLSYDMAAQPAAARIDTPVAPFVNPEAQNMQRQQLAAVMARLNSGQLRG